MLKKTLKIIGIVFAVIMLPIVISAVVCSVSIETTCYDVAVEGIESTAKIVCISDLHSKEYGKDNSRLLRIIAEQEPDAVFAVGDMINSDADENDIQDMLKLLTKLQDIAPVYFSLGNHEAEYTKKTGENLIELVAQTGAIPLDNNCVEAEISGNKVRIGGTTGFAFPFGRSWEEFEESSEFMFLKELQNTDLPTICLSHMPETIVCNKAYTYWHTDLFVSGHTHGGVIRVPGRGGLYAPIQGWWPQYDCGHFLLDDDTQIVISSGLSGYDFVPRIFNRPEICVINLIS